MGVRGEGASQLEADHGVRIDGKRGPLRPVGRGVPEHDGEGDHGAGNEHAVSHDRRQDLIRFTSRFRHDDRRLRERVGKPFVLGPLPAHQDDEADADRQESGEEGHPPERGDDPRRPWNRRTGGKSPVIVPVRVLFVRNDEPVRQKGKDQFAPLVLGRGVVFRRGHHVDYVIGHAPRRHHEADPAEDKDEQEFLVLQSPRRADRLDQDIGAQDAQEEGNQQAKIDVGEGNVDIAEKVVAPQREEVYDDGKRQADQHGPWRCYSWGGGSAHGFHRLYRDPYLSRSWDGNRSVSEHALEEMDFINRPWKIQHIRQNRNGRSENVPHDNSDHQRLNGMV